MVRPDCRQAGGISHLPDSYRGGIPVCDVSRHAQFKVKFLPVFVRYKNILLKTLSLKQIK